MKALACLLAAALAAASLAAKHALLIGIDEYKDRDGITRLSGAENDVDGLASALEEAAGFPKANIETLKGAGASRLAIVEALERLQKRSRPGDIVFFSFAGHGFQPGDRVFLVPYDAVAGSDAVMQNSSLPAEEAARLLAGVDADLLVAAYDMCRNDPRAPKDREYGSINSMSEAMARDLKIVASQGARGPQRSATFFASSATQRSWEMKEKRRGYFSWHMEQGLRGEAAGEDGRITVASLVSYLEQEVLASVLKDRGVEQRPDVRVEGSQVISFPIASPPNPQRRVQSEADRLLKDGLQIFAGRLLRQISEAEVEAASALFRAALALDPSSSVAALQLGQCAHKVGNYDEAERLYRKAIELDPKHSMAHNNLANLMTDIRGNHDEAERLYRKAIELDPKNSYAYNNLALLYKRLGRTADLEKLREEAARNGVTINP